MKTETRKSPTPLTGYARLKDTLQSQGASLADLIQYLDEHKTYLSPAHRKSLSAVLGHPGQNLLASTQDINAASSEALDLREQVHTLWKAVMIILNNEIDFNSGTLRNPDTRNASDALSKATSLASLLSKLYEDVVTQSRMQQVEHAVVEALQAFPDVQDAFLALLHKNLETIE